MKTLFIALTLALAPALAPTLAMAAGCSTHETATTCPTGQIWNSDSHSCVELTT